MQDAAQFIGLTGNESLVADHIGKRSILSCTGRVRTVLARDLGLNARYGDHLLVIAYVLVPGDGGSIALEHLKDHQGSSTELRSVNLDLHGGITLRGGCRELLRCPCGASVGLGCHTVVPPLFIEEVDGCREFVHGILAKTCPGHAIMHGRGASGDIALAVRSGGHGVERRKGCRLLGIAVIRVFGDEGSASIVEKLVGHERVTGQTARIKADFLADGGAGSLGMHLLLPGAFGAIPVREIGTGCVVPKLADKRIGCALGKVAQLDGINELQIVHCGELLAAIAVSKLGGDGRHGIREGAGVNGGSVACHAQAEADELVAPIRFAAQLLHGIRVVRKRSQRVVGRGILVVRRAEEPGSRSGIESPAVCDGSPIRGEERVVGVGLMLDALIVHVRGMRSP